MQIKLGYSLAFECPRPTPTLLALKLHPSRRVDLITPEVLTFSPAVETWDYTDSFGNICTRLTGPAGRLTSTEFDVYDTGLPDYVPHDAIQHDIKDLPDETLRSGDAKLYSGRGTFRPAASYGLDIFRRPRISHGQDPQSDRRIVRRPDHHPRRRR